MAERAAHLADRVLPDVPIRQWVLSVPYPLRYGLAGGPCRNSRGWTNRPRSAKSTPLCPRRERRVSRWNREPRQRLMPWSIVCTGDWDGWIAGAGS
jgi:hypothetical protein